MLSKNDWDAVFASQSTLISMTISHSSHLSQLKCFFTIYHSVLPGFSTSAGVVMMSRETGFHN